jgi:crotonobetainyl-CoA:carnitine CoA-transferase CaiB-like acyl-CoA transferase
LDNFPAHSGVESVPRLGEHTVEVLTELLDMDLSTIQELERLGILHTGRGAS